MSDEQTDRAFRYESDLVAHAKAALPSFLASRGATWRLAAEIAVGSAKADIIVARVRTPMPMAVRALSVQDSVVLAALRESGPTRIDILERRCGFGARGLRDSGSLDRLLDNGCVRRLSGGRVAATVDWVSDVEVIAIEAKLLKWRQAMRQAISYSRYANSVYVMLPASPDREDVWSAECESRGIGLLLCDHRGIVERVAPRTFHEHGWRREYAVSRVLDQSRGTDVRPA